MPGATMIRRRGISTDLRIIAPSESPITPNFADPRGPPTRCGCRASIRLQSLSSITNHVSCVRLCRLDQSTSAGISCKFHDKRALHHHHGHCGNLWQAAWSLFHYGVYDTTRSAACTRTAIFHSHDYHIDHHRVGRDASPVTFPKGGDIICVSPQSG